MSRALRARAEDAARASWVVGASRQGRGERVHRVPGYKTRVLVIVTVGSRVRARRKYTGAVRKARCLSAWKSCVLPPPGLFLVSGDRRAPVVRFLQQHTPAAAADGKVAVRGSL